MPAPEVVAKASNDLEPGAPGSEGTIHDGCTGTRACEGCARAFRGCGHQRALWAALREPVRGLCSPRDGLRSRGPRRRLPLPGGQPRVRENDGPEARGGRREDRAASPARDRVVLDQELRSGGRDRGADPLRQLLGRARKALRGHRLQPAQGQVRDVVPRHHRPQAGRRGSRAADGGAASAQDRARSGDRVDARQSRAARPRPAFRAGQHGLCFRLRPHPRVLDRSQALRRVPRS